MVESRPRQGSRQVVLRRNQSLVAVNYAVIWLDLYTEAADSIRNEHRNKTQKICSGLQIATLPNHSGGKWLTLKSRLTQPLILRVGGVDIRVKSEE